MGVRKLFATILYYHKKTALISAIGIAQAVSNLGFNLLFIPIFGKSAAAWTTFAAMFVGAAAFFFLSQRLEPLTIDYRALLVPVGLIFLALIPYLAFIEAASGPLLFNLGLKICLFIASLISMALYHQADLFRLYRKLFDKIYEAKHEIK